jgi:hypothetical protein
LVSWTGEAVAAGSARGAVISPFSTPRSSGGWKQGATETVERLRAEGCDAWVDSETHALQMPAAGDFRYYDGWSLWSGARGQLTTDADMRDHIERVFAVQDDLGVSHLAPTMLLHSPQSSTSQAALRFAEIAIEVDPACRLAIAGDGAFWGAGSVLDAHVGGLAQLEPAGWWLTVVRLLPILPVQAVPEDVHGLSRTVRALSEDGPVHVSHGDLAALPAAAAGADTIGTGWDPRQRVSAYSSYEDRSGGGGDGGQWFQQATLEGLLSLLTRADANVFAQQNPTLAAQLLPGAVPPGPKEAFLHHAEVLSRVVLALQSAANRATAYHDLLSRYNAARQHWPTVAAAVNSGSRADAWVTPLLDGHERYGHTEGF